MTKNGRGERGSTLVLVVLLSLILSASAIVALRDVARTAQAAGVYRTRTQAQLTSDAATRLFGDWAGNKSATLLNAIEKSMSGDLAGQGGVFGGSSLGGGAGYTTQQKREGLALVGGELEFNYVDLREPCGAGCTPLITDYADASETGLFQLADGEKTFETRRKAFWRVKIRDLVDGMPAPGYSGEFCFKKGVIAGEAIVGELDPNWDRANNVAQSRHGVDALLGPVKCGYN